MSDARSTHRNGQGRLGEQQEPDPATVLPGPGTDFAALLDFAARLQRLVPDAVLVGGTAAALHRISYDHVVPDLAGRLDVILDALDREGDWVTNRVAPGKIILGELGGIETRLRQLIRRRPLETETITLPGGPLVVPTLAETLRVKAFLVVKRNQVRDYLDVAALADQAGTSDAARVLSRIDDYYADRHPSKERWPCRSPSSSPTPSPATPGSPTNSHGTKVLPNGGTAGAPSLRSATRSPTT